MVIRTSLRDVTTVTSPVRSEPVTLVEAKAHLRVDIDDDDTYISSLIAAARAWMEQYLQRDLVARTWEFSMDHFPLDSFTLPRNPVSAIESITYVTGESPNPAVSTSKYTLDLGDDIAAVHLQYGAEWPSPRSERNAVTVRFTTGSDSVPEAIKHGLLLIIGDLYENRERNVVGLMISVNTTVEMLLAPYRIWPR